MECWIRPTVALQRANLRSEPCLRGLQVPLRQTSPGGPGGGSGIRRRGRAGPGHFFRLGGPLFFSPEAKKAAYPIRGQGRRLDI